MPTNTGLQEEGKGGVYAHFASVSGAALVVSAPVAQLVTRGENSGEAGSVSARYTGGTTSAAMTDMQRPAKPRLLQLAMIGMAARVARHCFKKVQAAAAAAAGVSLRGNAD